MGFYKIRLRQRDEMIPLEKVNAIQNAFAFFYHVRLYVCLLLHSVQNRTFQVLISHRSLYEQTKAFRNGLKQIFSSFNLKLCFHVFNMAFRSEHWADACTYNQYEFWCIYAWPESYVKREKQHAKNERQKWLHLSSRLALFWETLVHILVWLKDQKWQYMQHAPLVNSKHHWIRMSLNNEFRDLK